MSWPAAGSRCPCSAPTRRAWPGTSPTRTGRPAWRSSTRWTGAPGRGPARRCSAARWPGWSAGCPRSMRAATTRYSWATCWGSGTAPAARRCCTSPAPTTRSCPPNPRRREAYRCPTGVQMTTTHPSSASRRRPSGEAGPAARVPGPRGVALLGITANIWRDRLGLMTSVTEEFGDAVRFKMGPKSLYFLNHPDHAKHVLADNAANYHKGIGLVHAKKVLGDGLLTSEGELWKRQRKTINPAFRRDRLARFAGVVVDEAAGLTERWRRRTRRGPVGPLDVVQEMTTLTLAVLGQT